MQRTTCSVQHPTSDVRAAGRPLEAADLSDGGRKARQQITPNSKRRTAHTCHSAHTAHRSCDMCAWIAAASPLRSALARSRFTQTNNARLSCGVQNARQRQRNTQHAPVMQRCIVVRQSQEAVSRGISRLIRVRLEPAPTFAPTHPTDPPTYPSAYTRTQTHASTHPRKNTNACTHADVPTFTRAHTPT